MRQAKNRPATAGLSMSFVFEKVHVLIFPEHVVEVVVYAFLEHCLDDFIARMADTVTVFTPAVQGGVLAGEVPDLKVFLLPGKELIDGSFAGLISFIAADVYALEIRQLVERAEISNVIQTQVQIDQCLTVLEP